MPRRRSRRSTRRTAPILQNPVSARQFLYSGTTAAKTTTALTIVTKAGHGSYRVCWLTAEVMGDEQHVCKFQVGLRGESNDTESTYSFPFLTGAVPRVFKIRQSRGQGYWTPTTASDHVGWIKNLSPDRMLTYSLVVGVTERQEFNLPTSHVSVLPDNEHDATPSHSAISPASASISSSIDALDLAALKISG